MMSNGDLISGSADNTIKVWDTLKSFELKATITGHSDWVIALSSLNNGFLASSSYDKTIKIWNLGSYELHQTLLGHEKEVNTLVEYKRGNLI